MLKYDKSYFRDTLDISMPISIDCISIIGSQTDLSSISTTLSLIYKTRGRVGGREGGGGQQEGA
jgi:hypothetical protein